MIAPTTNQMELFNETTPDYGTKDPRTVTYCTVKFTVGWLPGALGFTEQAKSALAANLGVDRKIIRGSYAILGAGRDPLIQEGAALKRLLIATRESFTIPEYTLTASAADTSNLKPEKVKGSYLIEACKVEEFLERFNMIREQYLQWGKRVAEPENYQRIRDADELGLAQDWAVIASKYPTAEALADSVTCDMPRIEPFDASFTLADVAPATARYLRQQAQDRLNASVEGATAELVLEFKSMIESVSRNCGKRVRLMPPVEGLTRSDLHNAEVQQILRHTDNEDIPIGKLLVTVQRCQSRDSDPTKLIQVGKPEDLLLTEVEYQALRPYETDEHRALMQSTFDNLMWLANKISSVKSMLGETEGAESLTGLADEVSDMLGSLGGSAAEITKQLRNSNYTRTATKNTFNDFLQRITTQEIEVKTRNKTLRRKIKIGGNSDE